MNAPRPSCYIKSITHLTYKLERQIICATLTCRLLCRKEGSGGSRWLRGEGRSNGRTTYAGLRNLTAENIVGTYLVEPSSVVFVRINIKLHGEVFALLNVELLDSILTKKAEDALAGILTGHLNDVFLRHPRVSRTV